MSVKINQITHFEKAAKKRSLEERIAKLEAEVACLRIMGLDIHHHYHTVTQPYPMSPPYPVCPPQLIPYGGSWGAGGMVGTNAGGCTHGSSNHAMLSVDAIGGASCH